METSSATVRRPRHGPAHHHRRSAPRLGAVDGVVALVYVVLAVAITWHGFGASTLIGKTGTDQPIQMWDLTWTPFALLHGHSLFFSDYLNFPYGTNLLDNTTMTALGLLVAPVTLLFGAAIALTTALTLAFCCSAMAAYVLCRRFTRWRPAAVVGGLIFGFSPYVYNQAFLGHLNLAFVAIIPLIALVVHELLVLQRGAPWAWGLVLGLLAALQYFISNEVLATAAMVFSVGFVAALVVGRRQIARKARYASIGLATAVGSAGIMLAYPLWFSFAGPDHLGSSIQPQAQVFRDDLAAIIWPTSNVALAPHRITTTSATFAHHLSENGAYLGLPLLLVVLATVFVRRRTGVVVVAFVVAATGYLLSLGGHLVVTADPYTAPLGIPLPEGLLAHASLAANIVPARFTLYLVLGAAVIAAIGLETVRGWATTRLTPRAASGSAVAGSAVAVIVAIAILAPLVPVVPMPVAKVLREPVNAIAKIPEGSVALFYPYDDSVNRYPQAYAAMSFMHFKMPGGDSLVPQGPHDNNVNIGITRPSALGDALIALQAGQPPAQTPATRAVLRHDLRVWQIDSVLAAPQGSMPHDVLTTLTWLLGSPPTMTDGWWTWYHVRSLLALGR